jgi:hypothetical protein
MRVIVCLCSALHSLVLHVRRNNHTEASDAFASLVMLIYTPFFNLILALQIMYSHAVNQHSVKAFFFLIYMLKQFIKDKLTGFFNLLAPEFYI